MLREYRGACETASNGSHLVGRTSSNRKARHEGFHPTLAALSIILLIVILNSSLLKNWSFIILIALLNALRQVLTKQTANLNADFCQIDLFC